MNADLAFFIRRKLSKTVQDTAFFDPVALDMDTADFDAGRKVETPAANAPVSAVGGPGADRTTVRSLVMT
ncbi:hypothetical protein [Acidisphaera sp. S103]|uniref:hypothetical protein n=1 Tax=Acidisphaera sp. S103 TaxID=1747223 RepID=UPI001C20BA15|nr:hypothetical protein [Acidisphaera sp. S103]